MRESDQGAASHASHWGAFSASSGDDRTIRLTPHANDPDPSALLNNFTDAARHKARIAAPMIRSGWLENGPGPDSRRGDDVFVPVTWDFAINAVATELQRVKQTSGLGSIYGGSYGWASAGRFHHAQSQLHRFLNTALGGYVRSVNSYSSGAAQVLIPHVLGPYNDVGNYSVTWESIAHDTEVVLAFGGMALKNSQVGSGGISRHTERDFMRQTADRGCRFVLISPLRDDLPSEARAEWRPCEPGTDTALMLGMAHTLLTEDLHDREFLDRYTSGFDTFERYLRGTDDGVAKSAEWASKICGVTAQEISALARTVVGKRTVITMSHSLQRSEHGEQPVWMGIVLASMLGQIGLPGGGFAYALGAIAHYGKGKAATPITSVPQGTNGVDDFIPVARIADMLLDPGGAYDYNGEARRYPDIKLVYWAGGNPFHHHQDLNRLRQAFTRPDTVIVHDSVWTATTRHADIVLPATISLEREDIAGTPSDPLLVAMHQVVEPFGLARNDFDILSDIADALGVKAAFTNGRTSAEWLRWLFRSVQDGLEREGMAPPSFEEFWEAGELELPMLPDTGFSLGAFRRDPVANPLKTPSGRVEIFSDVVDGFGYADCPGHPAHLEPHNAPTPANPLWLIANQPAGRLHSQLDFGKASMDTKVNGRQRARLHPDDARVRGIAEGDIIEVSTALGSCLAAAHLSDGLRPGVAQLPTGAWLDLQDWSDPHGRCVHGNPNILTHDRGTSRLAQGCTGQLTPVEIRKFDEPLPPIRAFDPPVESDPASAAAG